MSRLRVVVLASLAVVVWGNGFYLRPALEPPAGTVFAGSFHWIDDFYNYAQYVQQAEDGHFLFRNKLTAPEDARPELVNLEWWLVGIVSRAVGRRPMLAFRVLAVIAALALVTGLERWLERLAVPLSHRLAALLLTLFGGGLGAVFLETASRPVERCLDLSVLLYPFLELLANPHTALGTALLLWALFCFAELRTPAGTACGILLGTVLGLVRPYDVVLLAAVRAAAVFAGERPSAWLRSLLPLLGLVPVLVYDGWVFFVSDQFAAFRSGALFPARLDFALASCPPLLLALLALRERNPQTRQTRAHLWSWIAITAALVMARPPSFSLQLLAGAGLPLLLLAATALRRLAPGWTALAALLLSTSALVSTISLLDRGAGWFVPRERMDAALALRGSCGESDRLLSPPDIGLYAIGLTACHAYLAHRAAPDYDTHFAGAYAFYGPLPSERRQAFLDRNGITRLVLPGFAGPRPVAWLGAGTDFEAIATVGSGATLLSIYAKRREGIITAR